MQPNIYLQIVVDLYSFNTKVDHVALRQILENVIKTKDKSSPVVKARQETEKPFVALSIFGHFVSLFLNVLYELIAKICQQVDILPHS